MIKNTKTQSGFTLIEMIFYMLFITLIIGGSLGIVYQLLSNSDSLKSGTAVEEEANFILKKIIWVLNDVSLINSPAINGTSTSLSVEKHDFTDNPVVVSLGSGVIKIKRGSSPVLGLHGGRFMASDLNFRLIREGSDPDTDLLEVSFILDGKSFKLTWHLR